LKKLGFNDGASVFYKYAQEAAPPEVAETPATPAASELPEASPAQMERKQQEKENIEKGREILSDVEPVPGPRPNEYEDIIKDDIDVDDASRKLEQIAGTLSDRRVIRYLAEFDIMLDKIGIASMFPELAEAQSKLIESYSYALTRVTKMLGMLSNNKAIMEMGKKEVVGETGTVGQVAPATPTATTEAESIQTPPAAT
jgi:hypothetical protein